MLSAKKRERLAVNVFGNINGRLSGATDESLMRDVIVNGCSLNLTALAKPLASRRLFIVTATCDDKDDEAVGLKNKVKISSSRKF